MRLRCLLWCLFAVLVVAQATQEVDEAERSRHKVSRPASGPETWKGAPPAKERADKAFAAEMTKKADREAKEAKRAYIKAEAERLKASADRKAELSVLALHSKAAAMALDKAKEMPSHLPGKYLRSTQQRTLRKPDATGDKGDDSPNPRKKAFNDRKKFPGSMKMPDNVRLPTRKEWSVDMPDKIHPDKPPDAPELFKKPPANEHGSLMESQDLDSSDVYPLSVDMPDSVSHLVDKQTGQPAKPSNKKHGNLRESVDDSANDQHPDSVDMPDAIRRKKFDRLASVDKVDNSMPDEEIPDTPEVKRRLKAAAANKEQARQADAKRLAKEALKKPRKKKSAPKKAAPHAIKPTKPKLVGETAGACTSATCSKDGMDKCKGCRAVSACVFEYAQPGEPASGACNEHPGTCKCKED